MSGWRGGLVWNEGTIAVWEMSYRDECCRRILSISVAMIEEGDVF